MPGAVKADLRLLGFKGVAAALVSSTFRTNLQKYVDQATRKNALVAQREIRKLIRRTVLPKNAVLTAAIKKSSKPLVDFGDLFAAITTHRQSWDRAFVGILSTDEHADLAKLLHDGGYIPVTEKMRAMFFYLWLASMDRNGMRKGPPVPLMGRAAALFERYQDWLPLSDKTRYIHIPPRPFIRPVFEDARLAEIMRTNWAAAVQRAFDAQRKKK